MENSTQPVTPHIHQTLTGTMKILKSKELFAFHQINRKKESTSFRCLYAPILYGILTIYWFIGKDFEQLVRYNRMGLLKGQDLTFGRAIAEILFHKLWYIGLTIVLPIILIDLPWWQIMTGFFNNALYEWINFSSYFSDSTCD